MELFHLIEDGAAIIRTPKGVLKQAKLYRRGERVFVGAAGGFVRIVAKFGDTFDTAHPDIKVIDLEGTGVDLTRGEPRFVTTLRAAA